METMTITRALAELKLLDARITKKTEQAKFVDITRQRDEGKALKSNLTINEFNEKAKASHLSIKDLIDRRNKIKIAILLSNAKTMVNIGSKEMTVIEAISRKISIQHEKLLLQKMVNDLTVRKTEVERTQIQLDDQVEQMLNTNLGKDIKADEKAYDIIAKPFLEANSFSLVDPLKIEDEIEFLNNAIEDFSMNVDFVLSESNAKTEITIE
jgi:hypothetical protein